MTTLAASRVLLLDDEPFMLKIMSHMLAGMGFTRVECVTRASAALTICAELSDPPALILVDINMPEMDGLEFIRKLAEMNFAGDLLLVSGEEERLLHSALRLVEAHEISILGYLLKPVSPDQLRNMLANWMMHDDKDPRSMAHVIYPASRLAEAIANDELFNHYQPKVELTTGRVIGVETLVRWAHPDDGLIFPDQFISIAETHDLIDALTRRVMTEALNQAARWAEAGLDLRVAVNVSMVNLASLPFADFIVDQATLANVPPPRIVLEVTESRIMKDQRAPLEILTRLRMKRFRLSIDDFGTGHSSLAQLRNIPFDELKIDQSFVHGANRNDTQRAIVLASFGLAKGLGMEVVAEGAEDRADWDFLQQHGSGFVQGYFIAKPMRAEDLPEWLRVWEQRVQDEKLIRVKGRNHE